MVLEALVLPNRNNRRNLLEQGDGHLDLGIHLGIRKSGCDS